MTTRRLKMPIIVQLLLISLLPFTFPAPPHSSPVLDVAGEKVQAGVDYYILSAAATSGGGLSLATRNDTNICPLNVVQEKHHNNKGLPVKFFPMDSNTTTDKGAVSLSVDFNVRVSAGSTVCSQSSTVWKLEKSTDAEIQWFVTTGGIEGNPGFNTVVNWFQILKHGDHAYKLVFCPTEVCKCGVLCRDLRILHKNGVSYLAANADAGNPFAVKFKKA